MGAEGLKVTWNTYGVKLTLEALSYLGKKKFFKAYAGLNQWHQDFIRNRTPKETHTLSGRHEQWIHQP